MSEMFSGSLRICGKGRIDGNQTILVWRALPSTGWRILGIEPELEALVAFSVPDNMRRADFSWRL